MPTISPLPPSVSQGTIAALNGSIVMGIQFAGTLAVQVTGTFVGTLTFQVCNDGSTWQSVTLTPEAGGSAVSTATAPGLWAGNVAGFVYFQVIATAWTSGSAVVTINGVPGGGGSGGSGSGGVTDISQASTSFTLQNAATANGNGTVASTDGLNGVLQLLISNSTGTCTVNVEGSFDNFATAQNILSVGVQKLADSGAGVNTSRAVISGAVAVAASTSYVYGITDFYPYIRARISSAAALAGCTVSLYGLPV